MSMFNNRLAVLFGVGAEFTSDMIKSLREGLANRLSKPVPMQQYTLESDDFNVAEELDKAITENSNYDSCQAGMDKFGLYYGPNIDDIKKLLTGQIPYDVAADGKSVIFMGQAEEPDLVYTGKLHGSFNALVGSK